MIEGSPRQRNEPFANKQHFIYLRRHRLEHGVVIVDPLPLLASLDHPAGIPSAVSADLGLWRRVPEAVPRLVPGIVEGGE